MAVTFSNPAAAPMTSITRVTTSGNTTTFNTQLGNGDREISQHTGLNNSNTILNAQGKVIKDEFTTRTQDSQGRQTSMITVDRLTGQETSHYEWHY
jgi:hypothetical protein